MANGFVMNSPSPTDDGQYKVVALKYRPQLFGELVGQSHIATALSNAIDKNRVGHAYLFTGARGVGETSSARIFAKCLSVLPLWRFRGGAKPLLIGSYILLNGACELKHPFWRCCYDNGNLFTTASVLDRGTQAGKVDVNSVGL